MKYDQHWIVTADGRRASLFACQRTSAGELHLQKFASIKNSHESEHDRGRPIFAGGAERQGSVARSGARAAPHPIAAGHTHEEEQRRFAREVVSWLGDAKSDPGARHVTLFAPARFLGLLRSELPVTDDATDLQEAELTHLRTAELAMHPAVVNATKDS